MKQLRAKLTGPLVRSDECATNTKDVGCRVATVVLRPSTARGAAGLLSAFNL